MWCDAGGVICSLDLSLVGCKSNVNCHKLSSPPSSPEIGFLVIPSRREESTNQITRPAAVKVLHIQLNQVSEVDIEEMFSYADQVSEYAV